MNSMRILFSILFSLVGWVQLFGQSNDDLESMAGKPRVVKAFPVTYKINFPRLHAMEWENDYQQYEKFLTPAVKRTQSYISGNYKGIYTTLCYNAARTHAQLDTLTMLKYKDQVIGTWRMITHRRIRFIDSVSDVSDKFYRSDTILFDNSESEVFAFFTDNHYKIFAKEEGDKKFKSKVNSRYSIENNRFLILYKLAKAGGSVAQIGIDENGYLIMNFSNVIEHTKDKDYINYISVVEQLILQKI